MNSNYTIEGMTIAITNMEKMLDFYSNIFHIQFHEKEMYGAKLYEGQWGNLKLLFCPAALAGNTATQNRHQFDILVADLPALVERAKKFGGTPMGNIDKNEVFWSVGIYDPDNNSLVFKELLEKSPIFTDNQ